MDRKAVLAITLPLLLTSMLTLAFNIHSARAELTDRKVGVSVGYWIQYGISVTWESNDPNATTPQYVLDSQQLVFLSNVVQSVSGTNVTFNRIMLFENGTEKSETYWIDVDTGRGSGYLSFIAANLSAGDIIYTGLGKGIGEINETITRTYLGEPVEINHHNYTTSGTSYFIYGDAYWNRATGVLYEYYMNHTDYTTKGQETYVTQETQWLYPIGIIGVAKTWTVNDDGPADFLNIQDAINAANPGDTIFVHSGTYYENVVVNKTVSLIGENWNTTVVEGVVPHSSWQSVIAVPSDLVTIANFTVTNGINGIYLRGRRSTVTDCVAHDNKFGLIIDPNIAFGYSTNVLRRNQLFNNTYNLFVLGAWYLNDYVQDIDSSNLVNGKPVHYLVNEENISIDPDTYPNIGYLGIVGSTNIRIANLSLSENGNGLLVAFSENILIENVEATYNFDGISLMVSSQTAVKNCNISGNFQGAFMYYSDNVKIEENRISHNEAGIFLMGSNNNEICHNDFVGNSPYIQARFYMSANNQIYHNNFICDTQQAYIETQGYANSWDDGYLSGGNYWSDYAGVDLYSGPHQNETGSDGIGDTPYFIDEDNQDNYPLIEPWSLEPSSPVEATHELVEKIETWNLPKGTENSLKAKLKVAIHMLDSGKEDGATRKLTAFINRVEMLREKTLTNEQTDELVLEAQRIIDLIKG